MATEQPVPAARRGPPDQPRLVLASASPRRRDLLAALGARFEILATDAEEDDAIPPAEVLAALPVLDLPLADHPALRAWRKAHAAAAHAGDAVVLGADTVVVLDGEVLNKPADAEHARAMLARLAGRRHTVYTGVCVLRALRQGLAGPPPAAPLQLAVAAAEVEFRPLADAEIADYIATGEPLDKAGAYGLQGAGGGFVREVRGSYTAVVGLPLPEVHRMLTAAGITGLRDPDTTYRQWLQLQGKEPLPCPPTLA
ncbi:MAG: Maf family protein [Chloroflexaceae bacterium]|nr:Maf family protein [Chloroflexaceae bacterium]